MLLIIPLLTKLFMLLENQDKRDKKNIICLMHMSFWGKCESLNNISLRFVKLLTLT